MRSRKCNLIISVMLTVLLLLSVVECAHALTGKGTDGRYKIALSNYTMANNWRVRMIRSVELAAASEHFKDKVELTIVQTDNSPEAQISSLDSLMEQDYDAFLVLCSSVTAMDPVLKRAEDRGILVVTFDGIPLSDDFWKLSTNNFIAGETGARFIVGLLGGKGNIVMDRGMVGHTISNDKYEGAMSIFNQYPDIKIVAEFESSFSEARTGEGVLNAMTAAPQIDAILGMGYVSVIRDAFLDAGRPIPILTGEGKNEALQAGINDDFYLLTNEPVVPGISVLALNMAVKILEGTYNGPKHYVIDRRTWTTNRVEEAKAVLPDIDFHGIEVGVNLLPDMPSEFFWPMVPDLPEDDPLYVKADFVTPEDWNVY